MLRPLIAGNWKMHKTAAETVDFITQLRKMLDKDLNAEVRLYPPATALHAAADTVKNSAIVIGAQNLHHEDQGAFTGELSAGMLKEAGATSVLIGHSERRQLFAETDAMVALKVQAAQRHALDVILCVGETLSERDAGNAEVVVEQQLTAGLQYLKPESGIDIAYEPVWAIGTGKTATSEQAQHMHAFIRSLLGARTDNCRILYGGSVKPENAKELLMQPNIDGVLVGGASLKPEAFASIIAAAG